MGTVDCKYCGAPIRWAHSLAGRRLPIDPNPTDDGNLAIWRDQTGQLRARVLPTEPTLTEVLAENEHRGMPHFATCPRRPKRKRKG